MTPTRVEPGIMMPSARGPMLGNLTPPVDLIVAAKLD